MLFKKNPKKATEYTEPEKMVLKIKTVDDIPVIKEMRKKIGNGEKREAIIYGYLNLKNDYSRYFGIPGYGSNRGFILGEIKEFDIIPGDNEPLTDNITIKNMIENFKYGEPDGKSKDIVPDAGKINETTRFFAIKKIALFYFNYYEIARFGDYNWQNLDEKEILDPVKDIYNYMDIMKLFYNGESSGN